MNTERIKEIQKETAYPNSVSVQQALLKVWNECEQDGGQPAASEEEITKLWERFSFVHESSDEDFTVRLMTKPEFEIAVQSLNVQGDAQQRYNMARERQEGYIEGYNYAKGLKEGSDDER